MRKTFSVLAITFALALSATAAPAIFVSSADGNATFTTYNGDDLTTPLLTQTSADFSGVTAFATGEVNAASDGVELVIGRGDVLEIRSSQDYSLLASSAGHQNIKSIAIGEIDGTNAGPEIVIGRQIVEGGADIGQCLILDPDQAGIPLIDDQSFVNLWLSMDAVAIGDFSQATPGNELFLVYMWNADNGGTQYSTFTYDPGLASDRFAQVSFNNGEGPANCIVAGDIIENNPGDEVFVGNATGQLLGFDGDQATGNTVITWRGMGAPVDAIVAADFLPGQANVELAVASGTRIDLIDPGVPVFPEIVFRAGLVTSPALAAGDVNADGGLEIIACSTDANGLHVIDAQATDQNNDPLADITWLPGPDFSSNAATAVIGFTPTVQPDTTPPVITLLGDALVTLPFGSTYTDPGATATDDVDGDLTGNIVVGGDVVDVNTPGVYILTYNVSDAAGNPAEEVIRTVIVSDSQAPQEQMPVAAWPLAVLLLGGGALAAARRKR